MLICRTEARPTTIDAYSGEKISLNANFLCDYIFRYHPSKPTQSNKVTYGLLNNIFRQTKEFESPGQNLAAIMLCFSHVILGLTMPSTDGRPLVPSYGWHNSKASVYSERSMMEKVHGNYHDGSIDFRGLLHIVNYFKPFLTSNEFSFTKSCYVESMPHDWVLPFNNKGSTLGREWRGTYGESDYFTHWPQLNRTTGFLDHADLKRIRLTNEVDNIDDGNIDGANGDPFQSLTIVPSDSPRSLHLLDIFNCFLNNRVTFNNLAEDTKVFTFVCSGIDQDE